MTEDDDYKLYKPVIDSLRGMAAVFAEPLFAPPDAGLDGVALRPPKSRHDDWIMAFTTSDGGPIEVQIDPLKLICADHLQDSPSAAQDLYETIVQEAGAHRSERQTLVVTTRKDPGPREIFEAYKRRLG